MDNSNLGGHVKPGPAYRIGFGLEASPCEVGTPREELDKAMGEVACHMYRWPLTPAQERLVRDEVTRLQAMLEIT